MTLLPDPRSVQRARPKPMQPGMAGIAAPKLPAANPALAQPKQLPGLGTAANGADQFNDSMNQMRRGSQIYDDGPGSPIQPPGSTTTVAGGPGGQRLRPVTPRPAAPTRPPARPMAPGSQAPAPIRPAAPGSMITTTAQPAQPSAGLRNDVYTPGGDPRLAGAQNATDQAAGQVQGGAGYGQMAGSAMNRYRGIFGSGRVGGYGINPNVQGRQVNTQVQGGSSINAQDGGRYLAEQDAALQGLGGPNRTELAKQALADFDTAGQEQLHNRFRTVGQNAARLGRLGMGDTGKEVLDVGRNYEQDRMRFANELARSVSEGDISDRFRRVDATSGLRGQEFGIGSDLRGEQRGERDYSTGLSERNVGRALDDRDYQTGLDERNFGRASSERDFSTGLEERNQDRSFDRDRTAAGLGMDEGGRELDDRYRRLSSAAGYETDVFNQGRANRDEFRSERGRQDSLDQLGLENRIRERELGNNEMDANFRRALARYGFGQEGMPRLDELLMQYGGG